MNQRLLIPRNWTPASRLGGDAPAVWLQPSTSNVTTGGSRQFTAANTEYLTTADAAAVRTGDIDFTIAAWVYLDAAGADRYIVSKWGGATDEFALWWDDSESQFAFDVAGTSVVGATITPVVSQWYLLIAEHDAAANTLSLWVNSAVADTTAHAGGATAGNSPLEIGAQSGATSWDGRVARVGYYKRTLTAAERTFLWNSGQGRSAGDLGEAGTDGADLAAADCVDVWDLNEASGDATGAINATVLTDTNTITAAAGITTRARQYTAANDEHHHLLDTADIRGGDIDFFFSTWIYADSKPATSSIVAAKDTAGGGKREYVLEYTGGATDRLTFTVFKAVDSHVTATANTFGAVPANEWIHVLAWHDASLDTVNIRVNGGAADSAAVGGSLQAASTAWFGIGDRNYLGVWDFDGRIARTAWGKPPTAIADWINAIGDKFYGAGEGIDSTALSADEIANWGVISMWDGDEVSGNLIDNVGSHDMTDDNTVTVNPGPGTELGVVVDGDPVQQILSKEGSDSPFVQETAAKKLVYNAADSNFGNRPTLTCDGSDDLLRYAGELTTATAGVVFVVGIRGAAGALHTYLSSSDEAGDAEYLKLGAAAANDHLYTQDSSDADDVLSSGTAVGASAFIHTWISSGTAISLRNNGAVDALTVDGGANNGDWFGDCAGRDNMVVGALKRNAGEADQFNGELADILVYDRELTLSEIKIVEHALAQRYHIALAP